jgi:2-methylcitrate dehydratase
VDQTTETIVEFVDGLSPSHLSPGTVHEATRRMVDSLACTIGGLDGPPVRIARALAADVSSGMAATVAGSPERSSAELAAFANTAALRYLDYNDTYFSPMGGGGHPSDLIPTALAVGEAVGAGGLDVLVAVVAAYEVAGRLAGTVRIRERGWDQGLFTVVASAMAAGKLLGLSRPQLADAVSLAIVPNVPTRRTRAGALSMWKGCATAGAARNGIFAALMASRGMTGPPSPFEGPEGIWDQVTGKFRLELPIPGPGGFVVESSHLKSRPAEYNSQGPLDLILGLRPQIPAGQVERIEVDTYWLCWSEIGHEPAKWDPQNRETADHSLPYLLAVGLVDGVVGLSSFTDRRVADPALRPLMDKIRITEREDLTAGFPDRIGCRLAVHLSDGRVLRAETSHPRGHARNPLRDKEIDAKFDELTEGRSPRTVATSHALRAAWWDIARAPRVADLMRPLADLEAEPALGVRG